MLYYELGDDMKISTKGRYALRLMIDLAQNESQGHISLKDVAKRQNISVKYLEQIASPLSKAGLIKSTRGPSGGYSLVKLSKDYTSREILEVVEGKVSCASFLDDDDIPSEDVPMMPFYEGLNKVIIEYLDSYTLADLVEMNTGFVWDFVI